MNNNNKSSNTFLDICQGNLTQIIIIGPDSKSRPFEYNDGLMLNMKYEDLCKNILNKMGFPMEAIDRIGIIVNAKTRYLTDLVKQDVQHNKMIRLYWKAC